MMSFYSIPDVFDKIERLFKEENGLGAVDFMHGDAVEAVKQWQTEGKMRADIDHQMIMALIRAIIAIDMHKEEIGLQYFPELMDTVTEFFLKGLTDCR